MSDLYDVPPSDPTHYPADEAIEHNVLGSVLLDNPVMDWLGFLAPGHFYFSRCDLVFGRFRKLWEAGSNIDIDLVAEGDPELRTFLMEVCASTPTSLYVLDYARRVIDLAQKRTLLPVANCIAEMALNGVGTGSIVEYMQLEIDKIRQGLTTSNLFDRWQEQGITAAEAAELGIVERNYVVEDLIREKSVSIFYGAPGEFKSALCMDLALCIANGVPWLAPLPVAENKQCAFATEMARVLWLNYDQGHDDIIERLGAMARVYGGGKNVTAISHSYPTATLATESQARALGEFCKKNGYRVLIVDSLLDVKGKVDLQEAAIGDVLRLWRIVAETGNLSVIIIAHNTKISKDLYGSQFIKAKLDHLYFVSRATGTDVAVIESQKQRSFGKVGKLYARWTYQHFDGTRTLQTARFWGDSTESKSPHPNNTTQSTVLKILMASPGRGFSVNEVVSILTTSRGEAEPVTSDAVRSACNRLVKNGSIGRIEPDDGDILFHYGERSITTSVG